MDITKKANDLTGQTFGSLTAIKPIGKKGKNVVWEFLCECGNTHIAEGYSVKAQVKKTKHPKAPSCGCVNKVTTHELRIDHGLSNHSLFWVWTAMLDRCYNPNSNSYHKYGAKGVIVCEEWKNSFKSFYDWAITNNWKQGLHLDKDVKCFELNINPKIYSPQTCQFLTPSDNGKLTEKFLINNRK